MEEHNRVSDSIPLLRDKADRDVMNENTCQTVSIEGMMEKTKDEAESGKMAIKKRGHELREEIRQIEKTLLKNVDKGAQTRLGILQRKKEELKEQRDLVDGYIANADRCRPNEADEDRDICMLLCSGNVLPKVAVSDALDIKLEKAASFAPANYGNLIVGTRPLKTLTQCDLRSKIEVTEILHHDINVIEPASNSQCWVTYKNHIILYSRDGTRKVHFTVRDEVIDMETCQSGTTTYVALRNNDVLKIRRTGACNIEYERPIRLFRTSSSIGSIAVDSSNRLFVFDTEKPIVCTYDEDGNILEKTKLQASMRKVRSVGHRAVFAASIKNNVVTIMTVNRSDSTTVTLARTGMEATQVCHSTLGFFAVLGYNNLKLHRFAEDGLFIDAYVLGQSGLISFDRQWFFRFSTFTVDGEGNIWVGDKHGNVKIYSPF